MRGDQIKCTVSLTTSPNAHLHLQFECTAAVHLSRFETFFHRHAFFEELHDYPRVFCAADKPVYEVPLRHAKTYSILELVNCAAAAQLRSSLHLGVL